MLPVQYHHPLVLRQDKNREGNESSLPCTRSPVFRKIAALIPKKKIKKIKMRLVNAECCVSHPLILLEMMCRSSRVPHEDAARWGCHFGFQPCLPTRYARRPRLSSGAATKKNACRSLRDFGSRDEHTAHRRFGQHAPVVRSTPGA